MAMKKITVFVLTALLVMSFAGSVSAVPAPQGNWYCSYYGQYYNNLTEDQRNQIAGWQQQRLEQRKQMLSQHVAWGWITQSQADQQITWMEQQMANGEYAYPIGGMGMSGMGMHHGGMRGGRNCCSW